jgi:hypothetical protein
VADPRASGRSVRVVLAGLVPATPIVPRATRANNRCDTAFGGRYRIPGTVKIDNSPGANIPVRRQVRLFDKQFGRLVRETYSDALTGAYSFDYLAPVKYFVVTHDYTGFYNAVVADDITPEPMP